MAELHRDPLQRPAQDGRLALREGRGLARARRGPRALRGRLRRPGASRTRGARRRPAVAGGGFGLRIRGVPPRGGAPPRLLLGALRQGPGLPGLHPFQALAGVRGGGARREGGCLVARGRKPHRRACLGAAFPLRGRGRGRHRGAEVGGAPEALRDLARAAPSAAAPLPVGLPGRGRVAKSDEAGGLRPQGAAAARGPTGGAVPVPGRPPGTPDEPDPGAVGVPRLRCFAPASDDGSRKHLRIEPAQPLPPLRCSGQAPREIPSQPGKAD